MTIEELTALTNAELKAKADELGIEYLARASKKDLVELIYAQINDPEGASEVAQDNETNSDAELELGNGVFYVPGQKIILRVRGEDNELTEQEFSLDELCLAGATVLDEELITLRTENKLLQGTISELEESNKNLQGKLDACEQHNQTLEKAAYREVINHPSQSPEASKLEWNGQEQMTIRARVMPNKGISTRIRGGHDFTLQYQTITVNKALFDVLSNDSYIQIDAVSNSDE
ncbi:Rho termination factor N-terminal domain-containing protein [Ignatzschineria cameli]|uniref:Rho termination factor-like N-terminal domain-containing protein n=1 Tax=Ignatzschineria cameli TaxID=2182793 RepID=A0ABX5L0J9_9GAMM|nr:Rho termination factor N-terminal domain-containing protein [Ignatzschineria cameli]PWD90346.1 hypothetical protein DC079_04185 [Ignatzschineria cameli]PWD92229.1 hypothetical protein DC081_03890 [Ignatzschineria cameli]PWD93023.1 hypothetical protein DC078_04185 [Ignatzschineria cameli]